MSIIENMIDLREAHKMIETLRDKLLEHMVRCPKCRSGIYCVQYVSLAEIKAKLMVEVTSDQKN